MVQIRKKGKHIEVDGPIEKKRETPAGENIFATYVPEWSLSDLIVNDEVKNNLKDAILFCQYKDDLMSKWELKRFLRGKGGCIGINMYGPPGTGKSISAEAIAASLHKKIIKVDFSEIQDSKWGGTEKKLSQLFESAEKEDTVIFFDEADCLLGERKSEGANASTNHQIKSHLLNLVDRSAVIVVFATNLFENYDRAFFRRILFHIEYTLPSVAQLEKLWRFHLTEKVPKSPDFTYAKLAELSIGLSGGDIKNLTLKMCIILKSGRYDAINVDMAQKEIESYKKSLDKILIKNYKIQELQGSSVPKEIKEHLS